MALRCWDSAPDCALVNEAQVAVAAMRQRGGWDLSLHGSRVVGVDRPIGAAIANGCFNLHARRRLLTEYDFRLLAKTTLCLVHASFIERSYENTVAYLVTRMFPSSLASFASDTRSLGSECIAP